LRSLCGLLLLSGPSAASNRAAARLAALSAPAGEEEEAAAAPPSGGESVGTEAFGPLLELHLDRLEATIAAPQPIGAHEVRDAAT
jgi:hypothetical protein